MNFIYFYLLPFLMNRLLSTLKFEYKNSPSNFYNKIFIFWHSKMLAGWYIFKNKNAVALVSLSKDGEILSNILEKWNYKVVRGSSSKAGKTSLNEIISMSKKGTPAVLTPDGPRGPAGEIKNGTLIISKENQIPIIPVKIKYSTKKILKKSWDRFEIPLPFSRCLVTFGKEFFYTEFLEDAELSKFKKSLAEEMN